MKFLYFVKWEQHSTLNWVIYLNHPVLCGSFLRPDQSSQVVERLQLIMTRLSSYQAIRHCSGLMCWIKLKLCYLCDGPGAGGSVGGFWLISTFNHWSHHPSVSLLSGNRYDNRLILILEVESWDWESRESHPGEDGWCNPVQHNYYLQLSGTSLSSLHISSSR